MDGDRISQALARIEAAARRIEQATVRSTSPGDLERRHAALRSEAGAALRELDKLIEAIEG